MTIRRLRVVLIVGLFCPALWSQTGLPDPLSGNATRPTFGSESQITNALTTTLRISTEVDDNALNSNTDKITDSISRFDPSFDWNLSRARWSFITDYTPGFSYSVEVPKYRIFSHNLANQAYFTLTKHLNLRLRNQFLRTSDPFDTFVPAQSVPAFGVLDGTNPAYLGGPTLLTKSQSGMDLTYMPARHTTLGVSGGYAATMYDDLVPGATYNRDAHVASGRAFLNQQISPAQSVGVAYTYSVITSGVYGRTVAESIQLLDSWQFSPKFTLTLFAGPQYTALSLGSVQSVIPLQPGWSWTAGGAIAWHGNKTGVTATAVRRVNDSGGLGGAVEMTSVVAGLTREIAKHWTLDFGTTYALSGSNGVAARSYAYLGATSGFTRTLGKKFSIDAHYAYIHQDRSSAILPFSYLADHNRFTVGVSYTFSNRLGI